MVLNWSRRWWSTTIMFLRLDVFVLHNFAKSFFFQFGFFSSVTSLRGLVRLNQAQILNKRFSKIISMRSIIFQLHMPIVYSWMYEQLSTGQLPTRPAAHLH